MNFKFDPNQFIQNLPYMGKGMLGIMVVILIIVGITALLNSIPSKKPYFKCKN